MWSWLWRVGLLFVSTGLTWAGVRYWKSPAVSSGQTAVEPRRTEPSREFVRTEPAGTSPRGPVPQGMVWIPGGEFSMGCLDPRGLPHGGPDEMADARPIHRVRLDGFWMDRVEVTNDQFAAFVQATHYVTVAERTPTAAEFPGARRKTSSPDRWCSRLHPSRSLSIIISGGGNT